MDGACSSGYGSLPEFCDGGYEPSCFITAEGFVGISLQYGNHIIHELLNTHPQQVI
jgi:hypothetical protein